MFAVLFFFLLVLFYFQGSCRGGQEAAELREIRAATVLCRQSSKGGDDREVDHLPVIASELHAGWLNRAEFAPVFLATYPGSHKIPCVHMPGATADFRVYGMILEQCRRSRCSCLARRRCRFSNSIGKRHPQASIRTPGALWKHPSRKPAPFEWKIQIAGSDCPFFILPG